MRKILLAEDDIDFGAILKQYLELQNFTIIWAKDGEQALDLFKTNSFDICVLDVMMPKIDGFTLAEKIVVSNPEIPFVFLTARNQNEDKIKGLKLGADDYLVKPYSIEELILKIEVFLHRSQKNTEKTVKLYQFADFIFEPENYLIKNETTKTTLTEREAQLLKLFLDNPNTVLKREKILMELWGSDDYFLGRSLDVFISRLRKIIKETPSLTIENIPRVGFKWVSE